MLLTLYSRPPLYRTTSQLKHYCETVFAHYMQLKPYSMYVAVTPVDFRIYPATALAII